MSWQDLAGLALPASAVLRHSAHVALAPEPRNVSQARRFVGEQVPDLQGDARDALLLLTSELVTNAVVHARTELVLAVAVTDDAVLVTVHDLDLGRSEQRTHERDGGRGLELVRALAQDAGQTRHPGGGKTSWFRLSREDAGGAWADEVAR